MTTIDAADFDSVFHSGPRIAIMTRLTIHRSMRFGELQKSTDLTAGNLASHLLVLEKAGCIVQEKFENMVGSPKLVKVTSKGTMEFGDYVHRMKALFEGLGA